MAHAPALLRTNTAPVFPASDSNHAASRQHSVGAYPPKPPSTMAAMRASQWSGTPTLHSQSSASLSSMAGSAAPQQAANPNGNVVATTNIINQKADASRSLYQICVALRNRLAQVPDFHPFLESLNSQLVSGDDDGPVEAVWNLLRSGHPLLAIYNCLQPAEPIKVDPALNDAKRSKLAIFRFVEACLKDLKIPPAECFVISDLTGNDTSGLVKVTQVVNYVLDLAEQRGQLLQPQQYAGDAAAAPVPGAKKNIRDHIVEEIVQTERKYVQDLENLHDLKKSLEQKGVIPGDLVHSIFLNINAILDFQRRFLIRVETTNSQPENMQLWGAPFVTYEEAFNIYQPFIANQTKAQQLSSQSFDKIRQADHPVSFDYNTLDGFLLKPMQRLVKYPLLLKDLLKKGSDDPHIKADLQAGIQSAERILKKANDAVERSQLDEALEELIGRVDDWKSHRVEQFGRLLQHGVYSVITGRTDQEKDYEIYLFECILLCCKEIVPNKDKSRRDKARSTPRPRNKNNKLQLKGRIFMTNVTEVLSFAKPGSYTVQIWWKGDPGVENFIVKFSNEEMMKKWALALDSQRKENAPALAATPDQSNTEFAWMRNVNQIENPYAQQEDDEDEEDHPSAIARGLPPRYPMSATSGPLSLQTAGGAPSPGHRGGDSYFSPSADSPASSRTSTASTLFSAISNPNGQYPFPRTSTPQSGSWEDNNRYTAPAMPRAPSRDGSSPVNAYGVNGGRNPRGPSLPAMASHSASHSQSLAAQQRNRSYSTPDINQQPQKQRTNSATPIPAVPGIPAHLHQDANIPRSQSGSPRQDLPIRSSTQSPGMQRERLNSQSSSYGAGVGQYPAQPIYPRQGTPGSAVTTSSQGPQPLNLDSQTPISPPLGTGSHSQSLTSPDLPIPTQLKVKVNCDSGNYFTLVVAFNISYRSLVDRIDAKLSRFTNSSVGRGNLRLRYKDEDGDAVTIESDDDIQIAFLEWREGVRDLYSGGVGEIELFCVGMAA